ncbi:MAG: hypothetical protein KME10_14860 [Plectolyngbya sp. WJT66-NPBG17]|nr:hypothetical protein [Plectolyngbya sp. WJT66-NPBG17]MBW4526612.1 hypothetical protein [Phormidium tanganyikae FI6-MK23]
MVERPIKKSERQASEASDATSASPQTQPSTSESEGSAALPDGIKPSSSPRPVKKGDAPRSDMPRSEEKRGKRNDRGNDRGRKSEKSDAPPINPALMRGPKPPKASAATPEVETPSEESESSETAIES